MSDDGEWDYRLTPRARDDLRALDTEVADRIVRKLDEVVSSEFRSPPDWLEPLQGTKYQKLVVGNYRALLLIRYDETMLEVHHAGHRRNIYLLQRESPALQGGRESRTIRGTFHGDGWPDIHFHHTRQAFI